MTTDLVALNTRTGPVVSSPPTSPSSCRPKSNATTSPSNKDMPSQTTTSGSKAVPTASPLTLLSHSFDDTLSFDRTSDEDLPVPSVNIALSNMPAQPAPPRPESRAYDSGLGSSIRSLSKKDIPGAAVMPSRSNAGLGSGSVSSNSSTIRKSSRSSRSSVVSAKHAAVTAPQQSVRRLSKQTCKLIKTHVLDPLRKNQRIKEYHPIVFDAPRRIVNGQIVCLRDLEKFLLFMASTTARAVQVYEEFCVLSINAIQTAAEHVPESEHTRPNDVPYTSGYFTNLVQQVREYARTVSLRRGEEPTEQDDSEKGTIRLHGGLAQTGQPATLVHQRKDGSIVPIGPAPINPAGLSKDLLYTETGRPANSYDLYKPDHTAIINSDDEDYDEDDDDDIYRSQARRARQRMADRQLSVPRCETCNKTFPRNCDLTKHQKTHSRPWKCPELDCPYHITGWPTEKEMERHYNDKHSDTPKMYQCQYEGCTYESKRLSNCKQHMEKTHGYRYERSKKMGKSKTGSMHKPSSSTSSRVGVAARSPMSIEQQPTPSSSSIAMTTPRTPASAMTFSNSPIASGSHGLSTPFLSHEDSFDTAPSLPNAEFNFNDFQPAWNQDLALDFSMDLTGIPGAPMDGIDYNIPADFTMPPVDGSISPILLQYDYSNPQLVTPQHSARQPLLHSFDDEELYAPPSAPVATHMNNANNMFMFSPAASQESAQMGHVNDMAGLRFDGPLFDTSVPFDTTGAMFPDLQDLSAGMQHGSSQLQSQSQLNTAATWLDEYERRNQ